MIERAFALLKGRYRRLQHLNMRRVDDLIPKVIVGCCILHNLCIDNSDLLDEMADQAYATNGDGDDSDELIAAAAPSARRQLAVAKRNAICSALWTLNISYKMSRLQGQLDSAICKLCNVLFRHVASL